MSEKIYASQDWVRNDAFTSEFALEVVAQLELVSPVAAEDGSIYTDENGALYSL